MSLESLTPQELLLGIGASLFCVGAIVLFVLKFFQALSDQYDEIRRLFSVQAAIVALVMAPAFLGGYWYGLFLSILLGRGLFELIEINRSSKDPFVKKLPLTYGLAGVVLISLYTLPLSWHPFVWAICLALVVGFASAACKAPLIMGLVAFFVSIEALLLLGIRDDRFLLVGLVYILLETSDSFAYLFGRSFGTHKVFPKLSAGKTLEGYLGGLASAFLAAFLLNKFVYQMDWFPFIALSACILFSGIAGDLLVSAYKRNLGRKDFAPVTVLHGGILDIYDAFLVGSIVLLLVDFIQNHTP